MSFEVTTLENGLTVASDFMSDVESVAINIWTKVGSRNETREQNGISHFIEHMAFKGTATRNVKQIAEEFDYIGGHVNAFTSRECTVYHTKVLGENIEKATELLADILQNSTYDAGEMEKERKVILQEIAMGEDSPDDLVMEYFQATAFPDQPIGRDIAGSKANIERLAREDLLKYIDDYYRAANMVVTFAGKIEHEKCIALVEKYFHKIPSAEKVLKPETAIYRGGYHERRKDLEQTHVVLGFNGYSYRHPKFYNMSVMSLILGSGMSSRLFQEIRENRGLCYTIYAYNSPYSDGGLFRIYSAVAHDRVNELLDATVIELRKAVDGITPYELKKAKTQIKSSLLMARENTNSRAQKLGADLFNYGKIKPLEEVVAEIEGVELESLGNILAETISSDLTFSILGNHGGDVYDGEALAKKLRS